jgi:hypothetical protein
MEELRRESWKMELKERSSGGKNAIEMFLSGKSNSVLYP